MKDEQGSIKTVPTEIDVIALIKVLRFNKSLILKFSLLAFILGIAIAVLLPTKFTASSTFLPQSSEGGNSMGNIGGLAAIAGINLGDMGARGEIPPELYPRIVYSIKFKKELLSARVKHRPDEEPVTYAHYYENIHKYDFFHYLKKFTIGLPGIIINSIKGSSETENYEGDDNFLRVTKKQIEHFERLDNQLGIYPNKKEGFVQLSFTMPEPYMAAQMAKFAEQLLQKELIDFKIKSAKEHLIYTEERFHEKKKEFENIQMKLANFRDKNQNISSAMALNELEQLESEYNFAFTIYNELAKQLEQAKLQVSKDTPVFAVIEPVTIPIRKSGPIRSFIIFSVAFLGFLFALIVITYNHFKIIYNF
ncbi:MAG TPA: Wzz/FepE/Etk N-terminal domain-containing protein [Cyclobacteriaceae bacterium]|mgnify:CR=1 FL=1|nr:Wzz/FepE/Etk N-terminal domain-containing protein [Cyclobacteriaceae bacterium]